MTTNAVTSRRSNRLDVSRPANTLALLAAPAAAIAAGLAAEWFDFRALRYPLLAMVLAGVTATSIALAQDSTRSAVRESIVTILLGIATWAAAETLYVVIHALRGEAFEAERFGPQWSQALGLIGVHAVALGAPTGFVAAAVLRLRAWWMARA